MRNHTRIDRLKDLRHLLKFHWLYFPFTSFNMDIWSTTRKRDPDNVNGFCHSAACALGSAALHPHFMAQGLQIRERTPNYEGYDGYRAGAAFFGLTGSESEQLFNPIAYPNGGERKIKRKEVIKRVDRMIAKYKAK